jgi:hypothetical protein
VLSWQAQLEAVKEEIGELEDRISVLREELHDARWATDAARVQGILAVREQHLERTKFHAEFIESRIARGQRATKPIPYSALANICYTTAQRTARLDTAETLKALATTFSAKAATEASQRLFESDDVRAVGTPSRRALSFPA